MQIQKIDSNGFLIWKDKIAELLNDSVILNFPYYSGGSNYGNNKCDEVAAFLNDGTAIVFAATEQDELIGWVWCHKINRMGKLRLHIAEISVSANFRRQGIGKLLLNTVESYAKENGYCEIDLLVTVSNKDALLFYETASFVPERYLMRKELF